VVRGGEHQLVLLQALDLRDALRGIIRTACPENFLLFIAIRHQGMSIGRVNVQLKAVGTYDYLVDGRTQRGELLGNLGANQRVPCRAVASYYIAQLLVKVPVCLEGEKAQMGVVRYHP
jgi:hypothetical protein